MACTVAAVSDLRTRRVPNAIPIALAAFGLAYNAFGGWRPALSAVVAGVVVLIVGTLPFSLKAIGGGDVKLLASCAIVFGLTQVLPLAVYTALVGGVLAIVMIALRRFAKLDDTVRVPYAVAIAGAVGWIALAETLLPKLKLV
ncbi:MAG TPA: prepilin peptidase [Candidatus Baltobacteraceae bacterium]